MAVSVLINHSDSGLYQWHTQFHSDDEKGLGPLVAGLSLGSPAFMHFKLMKKYSKNGDHKRILASFILRHVSALYFIPTTYIDLSCRAMSW
jgi:hypothetical protein